MRRLLFLDIDGVMNSAAWYDIKNNNTETAKEYHEKRNKLPRAERITDDNPCEPHISALNKLDVPGLELVISSSWRSEMTWFGWDRFFGTLGINIPVTGKTDRLGGFRGTEVLNYLIEQRGKNMYDTYCNNNNPTIPIDGFAVLDDDYDYAHNFIKSNWYCVNGDIGYTDSDIKGLTDILLKPINWPEGI
jgi:hypothetical protein